jgi:hypothetical protein
MEFIWTITKHLLRGDGSHRTQLNHGTLTMESNRNRARRVSRWAKQTSAGINPFRTVSICTSVMYAVQWRVQHRYHHWNLGYAESYLCQILCMPFYAEWDACMLLSPHIGLQMMYQHTVIFWLVGWVPYNVLYMYTVIRCLMSHWKGITLSPCFMP